MEHFEAIVVGSGFGGSVMAHRLSEAGKSVCVLERGQAYPPGSFARTPRAMRENFWDPSNGKYGLFNVWSFQHIDSLISAGLGGGSLIYANVMIRKDENWFVNDDSSTMGPTWPITRAQLDPHYDAVERIMKPSTYPLLYQVNDKTSAMREAAEQLGIPVTTYDKVEPRKPQWYLPLLAVTFSKEGASPSPGIVFDPGDNYHGAPRETCRRCGECDVGCNYGAKNTHDYTFLSLAKKAGADIRPLTEVKAFERDSGGKYIVTCVRHELDQRTVRGKLPPDRTYTISGDNLILSAGTFGSTYLLLKMVREGRLRIPSPMLGRPFSGNGDMLMFATRCRTKNGKPRVMDASQAPVITSTFRFPDAADGAGSGRRGYYLQDAGYPVELDYLWELLDGRRLIGRALRFAWLRVASAFSKNAQSFIDPQIEALIGDADLSSTSMPLLGMGRDFAGGQMTLSGNGVPKLELSWSTDGSRPYISQASAHGKAVAQAAGGRYTENPITSVFNRLISVHPLGGCPMGRDERSGVVDSLGRVFGCDGLYVADGSVMPGPVGANPSFTIAALADRFALGILGELE